MTNPTTQPRTISELQKLAEPLHAVVVTREAWEDLLMLRLHRAAEQSVPLDADLNAAWDEWILFNEDATKKGSGFTLDQMNGAAGFLFFLKDRARLANPPDWRFWLRDDKCWAHHDEDCTRCRRYWVHSDARLVDGAQATPQPTTCRVRPTGQEWRECGRLMPCDIHTPAAHPAGSADTALPLGSTSNGALDNAQGPNQLQGNVSRPAGSADTALREALKRLLDHGYQPMYNGRPSCPFCSNFVDDEEGHTSGCILVAALAASANISGGG